MTLDSLAVAPIKKGWHRFGASPFDIAQSLCLSVHACDHQLAFFGVANGGL